MALQILAQTLLLAGALLLALASYGVLVLPDALARQHAATKSGTLAVAIMLIALMAKEPSWEWIWRLAFIAGFLLATLPLASHMLARAAVRDSNLMGEVERAPLAGPPVDDNSANSGLAR